ncbi:SRPBCC family protein [Candidatus Entotheonella palauensis]|uniref:SRPBCC family protein n=1 Tax=Candidatus Entotheonella palauensis TaxID=93172 RepID=UPI000B7D1CF8|nr:SRPBCC family protein [Candidatus Entotheonella palauensis]
MTRYADGPTTEAAIVIHAPIEHVWRLVSDITTPVQFSEELQGVEWLDDGGPAVGARFRGINAHGKVGKWESTSMVTRYEPEAVFEWTLGDTDHPAARWRFGLEPTDAGVTLTFLAQIGPGRSGLSPAIEAMPDKEERIVARRLAEHRANMVRTIEGIKALAEAQVRP